MSCPIRMSPKLYAGLVPRSHFETRPQVMPASFAQGGTQPNPWVYLQTGGLAPRPLPPGTQRAMPPPVTGVGAPSQYPATLRQWLHAPGLHPAESVQRSWVAQMIFALLAPTTPASGPATAGFATLPVMGSLDLSGFDALTTLPEGLQIAGDLILHGCHHLGELPQILIVSGALSLRHLIIERLPDALIVNGNLTVSDCPRFAHLARMMCVGGTLTLQACPKLEVLPAFLTTKSLVIDHCPIAYLPNRCSVAEDLSVFNAPHFRGTTSEVFIGRHLRIYFCRAFDTWTVSLRVPGHLRIVGCDALAELPVEIFVGGQVFIKKCAKLHRLDIDAKAAALRADGPARTVPIQKTAGTKRAFKALNGASASRTRSLGCTPVAQQIDKTSSLLQVVQRFASWGVAALEPAFAPETAWPLRATQQSVFDRYLRLLEQHADFKATLHRPLIITRLNALVRAMHAAPKFRTQVLALFDDAVTFSPTGVIEVIEQGEHAWRIYQAEAGPEPMQRLRELGLRYFLLETVLKHAAATAMMTRHRDIFAVQQAYTTALAGRFDLPCPTTLPTHRPIVASNAIACAESEVLRAQRDLTAQETFLQNWSPWVRACRRESAVRLGYQTLLSECLAFSSTERARLRCPLTHQYLHQIAAPVFIRRGSSLHMFDYESLLDAARENVFLSGLGLYSGMPQAFRDEDL